MIIIKFHCNFVFHIIMSSITYLLLEVFFIVNILERNNAARILAVYPSTVQSHQVFFRPLTEELLKRGHEVVVVTTKPAYPKGQTPENLTEIDLSISKQIPRKHISLIGDKKYLKTQIELFNEGVLRLLEHQLQHSEFQELLRNKTDYFDLLLVEAVYRPMLALSHVFKAPLIQVSSLGRVMSSNQIIGASEHPLFYPTLIAHKTHNLTLLDKIVEIYNVCIFSKILDDHEEFENEIIKRLLGYETPAIAELKSSVHMLLVNVHPIIEGNHPVPPSLINIWGIHEIPEKKLPKDLVYYFDNSKNGVIYVSFGTNINSSNLLPEAVQKLVTVFSQLSYNVLWKWDEEELPEQSENIKIGKWFPQSDLLKHPKIKLFITQGGLQSIDEAISAGVPLIFIPTMIDQWYNADNFVNHKIGVQLDMMLMTEEQILNAIDTVIGDESYRSNVLRLNRLLRDQPQSALRRAADCVERAMRRGTARHMRAPAANMAAAEYFMIDIIVPLVLIIVIAVIFIYNLRVKEFITNSVPSVP